MVSAHLLSPSEFLDLLRGPNVHVVTGRNEVVAKVMFLQVCVCPQGGRMSASVHAGMPHPPGPGRHHHHHPRPGRAPPPDQPDTPWDQADPHRPGRPPRDQADTTPVDQADPPGSRLQHTVYERPVRILLECILVLTSFHLDDVT